MPSKEMVAAYEALEKAKSDLLSAGQRIESIQLGCFHVWKFSGQRNNYHNNHWKISYKCKLCDHEKVKVGTPVCGACHGETNMMVYADNGKPQLFHTTMNVPTDDGGCYRIRGFECQSPTCKVITLLWISGD